MKKKIMLLVATMALVLCSGAFAQEEEVAEESTIEESTSTTGTPKMYVGLEMGYGSIDSAPIYYDMFSHFDAFELVPVFGVYPSPELPDLAIELNFMMDFAQSTTTWEDQGGKIKTAKLNANIFSPQILVVYTFFDGPVRPFMGAGIGANFNTAKMKNEIIDERSLGNVRVENIKVRTSFSFVSKFGMFASIPDANIDLVFLGRYNINISKSMSYNFIDQDNQVQTVTNYGPFNLSSLSFSAGIRYNI